MNLIFMGPPGAGKGTQATKIIEKYDIVHISTGDMFRAAMKNETPLGVEAKKYVDQGLLVPDSVTNGIVKERLAQDDCKNGVLLDGFPRTVDQAVALEKIMEELNTQIDYVISLDVAEELLIARLTGRRMCTKCGASFHMVFNKPKEDGICDVCGSPLYQRKDDNEESAQVRLKEYRSKTQPLFDFYKEQNKLYNIDGALHMDEVFKLVEAVLEEGK
jgi:adenylate kinase